MRVTYEATGEFLICYGVSELGIESVIDRILPDKVAAPMFGAELCAMKSDLCYYKPMFVITDIVSSEFMEIAKLFDPSIKEYLEARHLFTRTTYHRVHKDSYNIVIEMTLENIMHFIERSFHYGYVAEYKEDSIVSLEIFELAQNRKRVGNYKVEFK